MQFVCLLMILDILLGRSLNLCMVHASCPAIQFVTPASTCLSLPTSLILNTIDLKCD